MGGGSIYDSVNGGASWSAQTAPAGTAGLDAISCSSATNCVAGGGPNLIDTTNGGATWTTASTVAGASAVLGISCPSTNFCLAVGTEAGNTTDRSFDGFSVSSSDGGTTWGAPTQVGGAVFHAASCLSAALCFAAGKGADGSNRFGVVYQSTDRGNTWTGQFNNHGGVVGASGNEFDGIDCTSTSTCFAVGDADLEAVVWTNNSGSNWSTMNDVGSGAGNRAWDSVSCWTTSGCIAVGAVPPITLVSAPAGLWHPQALPAGVGSLSGVSCPSQSLCVAVGTEGSSGAILTIH